VWSLVSQAGTGASVSSGTLTTTAATTSAVVRATITNGAGTGSTNYTQEFTITVTRAALTGTATINGTPTFGNQLSVNTTGYGSNPTIPALGTLSYQWLRGGSSITGATNSSYTLVAADVGQQISVRVTSANTSTTGVTSAATAAVARAAGANVTAPQQSGTPTSSSITVTAAISGANPGSQAIEYAITTSTSNTAPTTGWVDSPTFSGLPASTAHHVWARTKQNDTHSTGTAVRTTNTISTAAAGNGGGLQGDYPITNL
jgi:hypothetical protein